MEPLSRLLSSTDVQACPPSPGAIESIEFRLRLRLPDSVRRFYEAVGGAEIRPLSLRLLPPSEVVRLLANWPRFGFSTRWGYLPIAEDESGDLYCVCCGAILWERVCRVRWAGEDELRFRTLDNFLHELVRLLDAPPGSLVLEGDYDLPGVRPPEDARAAAEVLDLAAGLAEDDPDRTTALSLAERLLGNRLPAGAR